MSFFEKFRKTKGGYIFLSHSHDDIDKVREIRNALEHDGFEPLCFYLKCLDDDSEIEDLIKREIDAREWFVFVNSENSRKSKWVTMEREYIGRTDQKKILTIDLDDDNSVQRVIETIRHNLRIFLSYSARDHEIARRINERLKKKDYLSFFAPEDMPADMSYAAVIVNAIKEASQEGCVLLLLTKEAAKSACVLNEIEFAYSHHGNIVPLLLGEFDWNDPAHWEIAYYVRRLPYLSLSENPTVEEIDAMIDRLGDMIVKP